MANSVVTMLAMPVAGNFGCDKAVWDAAHAVAADTSLPLVDRLQGLRKMNELVGIPELPCDKAALEEYLESTSEYGWANAD